MRQRRTTTNSARRPQRNVDDDAVAAAVPSDSQRCRRRRRRPAHAIAVAANVERTPPLLSQLPPPQQRAAVAPQSSLNADALVGMDGAWIRRWPISASAASLVALTLAVFTLTPHVSHVQCPEGSAFHWYYCCGSMNTQCCMAVQTWAVVIFGSLIPLALIIMIIAALAYADLLWATEKFPPTSGKTSTKYASVSNASV